MMSLLYIGGGITADVFAKVIAICEMLPGPASTQMGIYSNSLTCLLPTWQLVPAGRSVACSMA